MANSSASSPSHSHVRIRPRVSVADRASRAFAHLAVIHGYESFKKGDVVLDEASETLVRATVRGKHRVQVEASRGSVGVRCSCAPDSLDMTTCKHVWATLLAIDRDDVLGAMRETPASLKVVPLARPERTHSEEKKPKKKEKPARSAAKSRVAAKARDRPRK